MALVVFDYDGVLADTLADLLHLGQEACNTFGIKHVTTADDLKRIEVMSFASYGRACEVPEHLIDAFVRICLSAFALMRAPPPIFTGLSGVVSHLAANHTTAIVTTNASQNVHAFLAKHRLEGFVHAIYRVDSPGSKAQRIVMARHRLSRDRIQEPVFMVGDSLRDVLAAREAAVTSIAVTWGHQSLATSLRGNPDCVVSSPHSIIGILRIEQDSWLPMLCESRNWPNAHHVITRNLLKP